MSAVLVTGAAGTVGRQVVRQLREAGTEVRALTRESGDLKVPGSLPLDGVESVFLVWPFATAEGARAVVEAIARRARRVVYLSSAALREHEREVERLIEGSGLEWAFLRPHAFAANALRWAEQVRAGVVRGPYGLAAMPPVHERDVAAVAVRALTGHLGGVHELTGPDTISQIDQVRILSEVMGLPVRWEEVTSGQAGQDLLAKGWPREAVEGVLQAQRDLVTHPAAATSAVEEITKTRPRTFGEWAREHVDDFLVPRAPVATMEAARIHDYGDASVIGHDRVPTPRPGPGEVLIEVAATSFNPSEVGLRAGYLREVLQVGLPHTLGWDVSGTVVEGGGGFAPGDRVIGLVDGAAAAYVVAPESILARAPRSIPLADAAAVPVAALTAWQAVHEHARVGPGTRVLINGAGGGVGLFAVQFAKLAGATVTATASPRSAEAVRRLGADEVVDYTSTPLPGGMDVVLNLAGLSEERAAALAGLGRTVVTIATPIEGGTHFVARNDPDQLATIVDLIDKGDLVVEVAESHPMTDLADLHRRAESGQTRGKITLYPHKD